MNAPFLFLLFATLYSGHLNLYEKEILFSIRLL